MVRTLAFYPYFIRYDVLQTEGICHALVTIDRQGQTRLTARLSGAFCPFRLAGRQPSGVSKSKNHSKIHRCQVRAVLPEQKCVQTRKDPQRILAVLSRGLTQYGRISARQNRVCPCQSMVWNSIAHFPQNSTPVCAIVRSAARTFIYRV